MIHRLGVLVCFYRLVIRKRFWWMPGAIMNFTNGIAKYRYRFLSKPVRTRIKQLCPFTIHFSRRSFCPTKPYLRAIIIIRERLVPIYITYTNSVYIKTGPATERTRKRKQYNTRHMRVWIIIYKSQQHTPYVVLNAIMLRTLFYMLYYYVHTHYVGIPKSYYRILQNCWNTRSVHHERGCLRLRVPTV